ncbi:MAG TPA: hypothetical protein VHV10_16605 [Ktedonobacteraceae bacterium]|jgi:hypothetical protein|nr:hypothetical protein [Ktedonobacteraceae bacterium]
MGQFNIRDMPEGSDQQLSDLAKWKGQTKTQVVLIALDRYWLAVKQERESQMQQDQYEVRVERVGREFIAWQGNDEHLSKEQFELWKEQENVEKVGRFVNGEWAEAPYTPRAK